MPEEEAYKIAETLEGKSRLGFFCLSNGKEEDVDSRRRNLFPEARRVGLYCLGFFLFSVFPLLGFLESRFSFLHLRKSSLFLLLSLAVFLPDNRLSKERADALRKKVQSVGRLMRVFKTIRYSRLRALVSSCCCCSSSSRFFFVRLWTHPKARENSLLFLHVYA